jgi:hypothetical protein
MNQDKLLDGIGAKLDEIKTSQSDRRRFLTYAGLGTLGVLGASKLGALEGPLSSLDDKAVAQSDVDVAQRQHQIALVGAGDHGMMDAGLEFRPASSCPGFGSGVK